MSYISSIYRSAQVRREQATEVAAYVLEARRERLFVCAQTALVFVSFSDEILEAGTASRASLKPVPWSFMSSLSFSNVRECFDPLLVFKSSPT